MNIVSLLLVAVAVALFLVAGIGRDTGRPSLVALGLACLSAAWTVQLVFPGIQQVTAS